MTKEQFKVERALEKYVLHVANFLFIATGVVGAVLHHWVLIAFAVVACFINGIIAIRLPKNIGRSFAELSQDRPVDAVSAMLKESSAGLVDTSGAASASVRSAYLCAALAGAIAWDFGLAWWQIAFVIIAIDFLVMFYGAAIIGTNRTST